MSWLTRIKEKLLIRTGDGLEYSPIWVNAEHTLSFNLTEFEFPNKPGTLVIRRQPKGVRYALDLKFQGDDHVDIAAAFMESAKDPRVWEFEHPYHGILIVQPISLQFVQSTLNITEISGEIVETIVDEGVEIISDPEQLVKQGNEEVGEASGAAAENATVAVTQSDVNTMNATNDLVFANALNIADNETDKEDLIALFNDAVAKANSAASDVRSATLATSALITAPSRFAAGVERRIDTLIDSFNTLRLSFNVLSSVREKKIYENDAGAIFGSVSVTAVTPNDTDFATRISILNAIEKVLEAYDSYIVDLNAYQDDFPGDPNTYLPDADTQFRLNKLVALAISSLFDLALSATQERTITLEFESNPILLAHRFYGVDPAGDTIQRVIAENSLGLNELFQIKPGREIVFYV